VDAVPSDAGGALFVDPAGAAEEARDPATLSMYSSVEVELVALAVAQLRAEGLDVGVIAPYSAQVARIRARVPEVEVATVNAFQGREMDAIVVSFVRSNDRGELGFVADGRRLTVALTRARRRLVLIGDAATLGRHPRFAALLGALAARGAVRSVWEEPWVSALG
jgi:ATP-dependent RNA/DNA helicase IGHMBP2